MTNLTPVTGWDDVPQLETQTRAVGGPGGAMNAQAQALLNRTQVMNPDNLLDSDGLSGDEAWSMRKGRDWWRISVSRLAGFILTVFAIAMSAGAGAASRTVLAKLRDLPVTPKDFGAVGDGTHDDGAAVQAMFDAAKALGLPVHITQGTYLVNSTVKITGFVGLNVKTDGFALTKFIKTTNGDMFVLDSCQRGTWQETTLDGSAIPTSGRGFVVTGSNVGLMKVQRNQVIGFPEQGAYFDGSIESTFNAFVVAQNLFLSNGVRGGTGQFFARHVNDSRWEKNDYGTLTMDGPFPKIGCELVSCSGGNHSGDYHWNNVVGAEYSDCDYARFDGMRWETNRHEGARFIACVGVTFGINTVHTNSMEQSGAFDAMSMTYYCREWTFTTTNFFEWTGGTTLVRYCLTIDETCSNLPFSNVGFRGFAVAPVNYSRSSAGITFTNCQPSGYGLAQVCGTWLQFNTGTRIQPGQTLFCGPNGSSATEVQVAAVAPRASCATMMTVLLSDAPGDGESITVTMRQKFNDTPLKVTVSGTNAFTQSAVGLVGLAPSDLYSMKVVASAKAAPTYVLISFVIEN